MILLNDQFVSRDQAKVDIEDRGYQFGDGIYEVVRVYQGKPFKLEQHLKRFERSAKELRLSLPMSLDEIKTKLLELLEMDQLLGDGIIYFQATRGVSPRTHSFPENVNSVLNAYTREVARPVHDLDNGAKVVTFEDIRWLRCDIKSLNLLGNVLAKQYAVENQAKEAIQIRSGIVTEGSASNFFFVKNGNLYTHPANQFILKGITRDTVEEIAAKLNISFIEKEFTLDEVLTADEAFVSGTITEITPVLQIDNHQISKEPGPITKALQKEFANQF